MAPQALVQFVDEFMNLFGNSSAHLVCGIPINGSKLVLFPDPS